jgi:hypothetical protein
MAKISHSNPFLDDVLEPSDDKKLASVSVVRGLLKQLEQLGKDWLETVHEDHKRGEHTDYADGYVACYFAATSNHTCVTINGFQISYFSPPQISFKIPVLAKLEDTLVSGRALLEAEKKSRAQLSDEKRNAAKELRKNALLKELQELEGK